MDVISKALDTGGVQGRIMVPVSWNAFVLQGLEEPGVRQILEAVSA
jgi:hypothetical protein